MLRKRRDHETAALRWKRPIVAVAELFTTLQEPDRVA